VAFARRTGKGRIVAVLWAQQFAHRFPFFLKLDDRTEHSMDFLGCRVFRQHQVLNRRSRQRFRRKLARLEGDFAAERIDEGELQQRATALVAFTRTAGLCGWRFRRAVLEEMPVSGHKARPA